MSEDLECPICLQEYDLADKQPRMLLCSGSHELCAGCVSMLDITGGSWTCPQCRESVRATSNPNRSLMAALELHARVKEHTEALKAEAAKLEAAVAEGEAAKRRRGAAKKQRARARPAPPAPPAAWRQALPRAVPAVAVLLVATVFFWLGQRAPGAPAQSDLPASFDDCIVVIEGPSGKANFTGRLVTGSFKITYDLADVELSTAIRQLCSG